MRGFFRETWEEKSFGLGEQAAEGGFSWLFNRDFEAFEAEQNLTGEGHSQV